MKTVKTLAILAISGATLFFAACSETESIDDSLAMAEKSAEIKAVQGDTCTYEGELTEAETAGLLLMREEEKLARDVYLHFFDNYDFVLFQNIAKSEDTHMSAVLSLLEGYGIEDPALEGAGEFSNDELATLYAELIAEGEKGLVEALKVGATIEDLDIKDLQDLLAETINEDVMQVYENLLAGSESHMRAFVNALANLDESYEPQFISEEEFAAILDGENENGNNSGQGTGNGSANGQGNTNGNNSNSGNGNGTQTGSDNGSQNGNSNSGNSQNGTGTENCDETQSGSVNGNQAGSADGTQSGSADGNQNENTNSGTKGNSAGNGK